MPSIADTPPIRLGGFPSYDVRKRVSVRVKVCLCSSEYSSNNVWNVNTNGNVNNNNKNNEYGVLPVAEKIC